MDMKKMDIGLLEMMHDQMKLDRKAQHSKLSDGTTVVFLPPE